MVIKRDGRKVKFDAKRIENAVVKAFCAVDGAVTPYALQKAKNISDYVLELTETLDKDMTVEEIQDIVEHGLMSCKRKDVARAYISYRNERTSEREKKNNLRSIVGEKLSAAKVQNQNANVDEHSFGGRTGEAISAVTKQLALDEKVSAMSRNNHLNNRIYIHDLDSYYVGSHNCLSIPFDDLLANGFNTRQTDVRPAGSISTAFQLVAVIFQLQSLQQFGGVSATHLDWTMVPYVRKSFYKHLSDGMKYLYHNSTGLNAAFIAMTDNSININKPETISIDHAYYKSYPEEVYTYAMDMTKKELEQAVEGMFHNLNTLQSRSGNQLPFTSINFGTCTSTEGRMVTKAILEGCIKGVGKFHKTSIFPCLIFQYMKDVNDRPGTPNYDLYRLALESTAKRIYPNYANVDWSGNAGYDKNDPRTYFSTMGKCKLQLM